jgi:PTS system nitrogen regulatory IIA component
MKIADMLDPRAVVAELQGKSKPELLRELCAPLAALHAALPEERLVQTLLDRERLGSTGLAEGVAIPHGKLRGIEKLIASFGRCVAGVDFDSLDKEPTHLFFAIFAPEASSGDHLRALARISRLLRNPQFRAKVLQAPNAPVIYGLIQEEDSRF